ncbi:MAG: class I SAM-dependent methyltransferase [Caldimonas sp.]
MSPGTGTASPWLLRWAHLIAPKGRVLDVAAGSGRHARWLAGHGFSVTAIDRDATAMQALADCAETIVADIENGPWPLAGRRFNAVLVTNYLWRPLWPALVAATGVGGVFLHETFAAGNESVGRPARPDFLLAPGELPGAVAGLRIVAFEDGFLRDPDRFVQRIVAVRAPPGAAPARYPLIGAGRAGSDAGSLESNG